MTDLKKAIKELSEISCDINQNNRVDLIELHGKKIKIIKAMLQSLPYKIKLKCKSQYSFKDKYPHAKSACTTISVFASIKLLQCLLDKTIITCNHINQWIEEGVIAHESFFNSDTPVDHLDQTTVLKYFKISNTYKSKVGYLKDDKESFEKILTDICLPLSEKSYFKNIQNDKYTAVIITKTPETIFVIIPPDNSSFIFFDSHVAEDSTDYTVESFSTFHELIDRLKRKFPFNKELYDSIPQSKMNYNVEFDFFIFDAFAFQLP